MSSLDALMPIVNDELRRLARRHLSRERANHTLQPTALVHEAYLKLVGKDHPDWKDRTHFFAVAAKLMRRILVDHARSHQAAKRGGEFAIVPLEDSAPDSRERIRDLVAIDDALEALGKLEPRRARVIELRYFGGLDLEQTAEALGVSTATVVNDARHARAWLYRELQSR